MTINMTTRRAKILIADDEIINHELLAGLLEEEYDLDFAINGQQALDKLNQQDYDALLLDMLMPVLDGRHTLKIIRQQADLLTLPIIMISGVDDEESIAEIIEMGANDYISKPIDSRIVLARIQTQLKLKQVMDERKTMNDTLEAANSVKVRMMQIASHDLRNPLNNLRLLMTLFNDNDIKPEEMPKMLQIANTSIETMLGIINDFLGGAELMDETPSVVCKPLSSNRIMETILLQYTMLAMQKNIGLVIEDINDVTILADDKRLTQVISNLISNAIKYTPRDGNIYLRSYSIDDMWRLEIQDTGPGIPQEERQHLFQAFSKNNISTKPTGGESSTGLGLWIAAEMMRIQRGTIGMDSPQEGGCCFWIEIPCAGQHQEHMLSVSA